MGVGGTIAGRSMVTAQDDASDVPSVFKMLLDVVSNVVATGRMSPGASEHVGVDPRARNVIALLAKDISLTGPAAAVRAAECSRSARSTDDAGALLVGSRNW